MCGICGYYNLNGKAADKEDIRRMCEAIKHRGPDDEGIYTDGSLGIGMRRLSIIDIDTGHQPIHNEDKSVWTVLNGEIYNYVELTEELKKNGHIFSTKSDTEVIVHLYEEYGLEFVKHLRGMFGLALWDSRSRELLLARDPLGIKQLYYFKREDKLIFGSEIKSILKNLDSAVKMNYEALNHYFTFLYFPNGLTIYDGITELKPGNMLRVTKNGSSSIEYWNLNRMKQEDIGFEEAKKEFLRLLTESMAIHLRSDVPLGIFLSGGIDSSIITALASQLSDSTVNTFTVGYGKEGGFYDEREQAREVARIFKTNHQEYVINPDIEETINKLIYYFDVPFANSSAIPNFHISRMMRQKVKVALSGLGGDELAGGYERQLGMKLLLSLNKFPPVLKNLASGISNLLPDSKRGGYFTDRLKRFMRASKLSPLDSYYSIITAMKKEDCRMLMRDAGKCLDDKPYRLYLDIMGKSNQPDILRQVMYFDLVSYMTNDLLVLSDRTSMANSLELRVPFLDHKLVEFMFQLPLKYKIKGLQKKYLFKEVFKDKIPKKILYGKKRGFSTPLSVWLRSDLQQFARNVFTRERIRETGVLNYDRIQVIFSEHMMRKANHQGIIFAMLTFIIWHEMYIQGKHKAVK